MSLPPPRSRNPARAHRPTHNSLISTIFPEPPHSCRRCRRYRRRRRYRPSRRLRGPASLPPHPNHCGACASTPFRRDSSRQRARGASSAPVPRSTLGSRSLHCGCAASWKACGFYCGCANWARARTSLRCHSSLQSSFLGSCVQPTVSGEFSSQFPGSRILVTSAKLSLAAFEKRPCPWLACRSDVYRKVLLTLWGGRRHRVLFPSRAQSDCAGHTEAHLAHCSRACTSSFVSAARASRCGHRAPQRPNPPQNPVTRWEECPPLAARAPAGNRGARP